eukprot:1687877-Pyramimonas_sp.AAC.1
MRICQRRWTLGGGRGRFPFLLLKMALKPPGEICEGRRGRSGAGRGRGQILSRWPRANFTPLKSQEASEKERE